MRVRTLYEKAKALTKLPDQPHRQTNESQQARNPHGRITTARPAIRRISRWALQLLGFLVLIYLLHLWQIQDAARGTAPELSGQLLTGGHFDLSNSDSTQIVHFWATWCPVCKLEADTLDRLAEDYPLITVAMDSGSPSSIREYLDENLLGFPVIHDPSGRFSAAWGVKGVPTTFIVDREGRIRFIEVGYTTGLGIRSRYWWAAGNHLR